VLFVIAKVGDCLPVGAELGVFGLRGSIRAAIATLRNTKSPGCSDTESAELVSGDAFPARTKRNAVSEALVPIIVLIFETGMRTTLPGCPTVAPRGGGCVAATCGANAIASSTCARAVIQRRIISALPARGFRTDLQAPVRQHTHGAVHRPEGLLQHF
jgi:hypothetical protein